ncbi:MAG TPA: FtsQ-type POTRA domain-containing protein, partial [Candidatus Kapabacteria bacterium]|nr:FtsQ-type POTRA domain-containing protein [Candidatus Kapabacteria bacterium]
MILAKISAIVVVLMLAGLAVVSYRWRANETIEKINVNGLHMLKEQEILNDAQIMPGGKLSAVDLKDIRMRLQQNPFVARAIVRREKDGLNIDVTERVPAARVDIGGTLSFMDTAGVIFPQRSGMMLDIPIVYGITKTIDGKDMIDTAAVCDVVSVLRAARASDAKIANAISVI